VGNTVSLNLVGYKSPGGNAFIYNSVSGPSGAVPEFLFDTRDISSGNAALLSAGAHYHPFTVLQSRGIHIFQLRATGVRASDGALLASPISPALMLVEPTLYERWLAAQFRGDALELEAAPTADPDGDGLSNRLEYALGGSARVADADRIAPVIVTIDHLGSRYLGLQFRRPADTVSSRNDVTLRVEASSDLVSWTPLDLASQTVLPAPPPAADGVSLQLVRDSEPLLPGSRRFLRLVVQ
jgi:hypothetical protein